MELLLRCQCGQVRARALEVSPQTTNHTVCYCRDCRAFALWLDRADTLDAAGGADVVQMARSRVVFDQGLDQLSCMRLSAKGMVRWYSTCCRTPIGNTVPQAPFIGVVTAFVDPSDAPKLAKAIPPASRVKREQATGVVPADSAPTFPMYLHVIGLLARWVIGGMGGDTLFDRQTKAPRVAPRVLTPTEREAIKA